MTKNTRGITLLFAGAALAVAGLTLRTSAPTETPARSPGESAGEQAPARRGPTHRTHALLDPERTTRADVVAMSPERAADELRRIEQELEDEHAIERLNGDDLDVLTRARFGAKLHTLTLLREHVIQAELAELEERVEAYEATHEERVARALGGEETPP